MNWLATGLWHDALVRKGSRFGVLAEGGGYEDYLVGVIEGQRGRGVMAEIDDVLAELRHRIMGPLNIEQRHKSAAVALRRLAHPGRDGGVVVEDAPASEPIRRLEEAVAFIERRTAELNERDDGAAPRPTESVAPAVLVRATPTLQDDDTGTATISLRFDTQVLARIDAAARRHGVSRTAWLHIAASKLLEDRR